MGTSDVLHEVHEERTRQDEKWLEVFGHIELPDGEDICWDWPHARDRDDYGVKTVDGRQWRVPRLSYMLATGTDPGELHVRHSCDRPPCFRPSHLLLGTNLDNVADKVERGRAKNQYTDATHCAYEHEFTSGNIYVNPSSGSRQCRICRREFGRLDKRLKDARRSSRKVLREVFGERLRQDAKFGEQNHPDLDQVLLNREGGCTEKRMAEHYEICSADRARWLCDEMFRRGQGTWGHILVEEVAEAICTLSDTPALRAELVQIAAVATAWIEAIDRRALTSESKES